MQYPTPGKHHAKSAAGKNRSDGPSPGANDNLRRLRDDPAAMRDPVILDFFRAAVILLALLTLYAEVDSADHAAAMAQVRAQ
jgi:hypothetical protein